MKFLTNKSFDCFYSAEFGPLGAVVAARLANITGDKALIDRKASTAEQAMKRHIVNTKRSILIEYQQNNGMD